MTFCCENVEDLCDQMAHFSDKELLQICETALCYLHDSGWEISVGGQEVMNPTISCKKTEELTLD